MSRKNSPTTVYLSDKELSLIDEIANREERPRSRMIQFAIRAFAAMYLGDRGGALKLAGEGEPNPSPQRK